MVLTMDGPSELWRMRKQFALQVASSSFMSYVLCLSSRHPSRFHLSRATGLIAMTELLPGKGYFYRYVICYWLLRLGISNVAPVFATADVVPFRLTPNMQHFLGPIFTEGILTSGIMSIGRCLTEPEVRYFSLHICYWKVMSCLKFDLEQQLCLFARDEVSSWMGMRGRPWTVDMTFRQCVTNNIDGVVKRAETMACKNEREQVSGTLPIIPFSSPV